MRRPAANDPGLVASLRDLEDAYRDRYIYSLSGDGTSVVSRTFVGKESGKTLERLGLGLDCSHFVERYLLHRGFDVPYLATSQVFGPEGMTPEAKRHFTEPSSTKARVGDVVYFSGGGGHTGVITSWDGKTGEILHMGEAGSIGRTSFTRDNGFFGKAIVGFARARSTSFRPGHSKERLATYSADERRAIDQYGVLGKVPKAGETSVSERFLARLSSRGQPALRSLELSLMLREATSDKESGSSSFLGQVADMAGALGEFLDEVGDFFSSSSSSTTTKPGGSDASNSRSEDSSGLQQHVDRAQDDARRRQADEEDQRRRDEDERSRAESLSRQMDEDRRRQEEEERRQTEAERQRREDEYRQMDERRRQDEEDRRRRDEEEQRRRESEERQRESEQQARDERDRQEREARDREDRDRQEREARDREDRDRQEREARDREDRQRQERDEYDNEAGLGPPGRLG